jgi:hypothetical protein
MAVTGDARPQADEGGGPSEEGSWVGSGAAAPEHLPEQAPHGLDRVGGLRQAEGRMREIGAVGLHVAEELPDRHLDAGRPAVGLGESAQAFQGVVDAGPVGRGERAADELMDLVADGPAAERIAHAAVTHLQLEQQVKVAELQDPAVLLSEPAHAGEIVGDQGLNAPCWAAGNVARAWCQPARLSLPGKSTGSRNTAVSPWHAFRTIK